MKTVVSKAVERAQSQQPKKGAGEDDIKNRTAQQDDEELKKLFDASKAQIRVLGVGGGGSNTIARMKEIGIHGADTYAINTDAQALLGVKANRKVLVGKHLTRGLGAGSDPSVGEAAAIESETDLKQLFSGTDLAFITCGMGGGTGTGAAPVIARVSRELGALTIGVVTIPFTVEGKKRMENAMKGLDKLRKEVDTLIVIPNDKILEIAPDLSVNAAFKVADEVLTNAVKGITEMITKPGLINLDFADLRTILSEGGAAMIGLGESQSEKEGDARALEAVENALTSPLLDVNIADANRALINVVGGSDMTLREAEMIVEAVSAKINSNAHIIWGAMIDDTIPNASIQAMVVVAGGRFPYLEDKKDAGQQGIESASNEEIDLGIAFT